MAKTIVTDAERIAIEQALRAKLAACDAASDEADLEGLLAHYSDGCGLGMIYNGAFFPTVDALTAAMRDGFGCLQSQTHTPDEFRIAVLARDVAIMVWHGEVSATYKDGSTWRGTFARTFVCVKEADEWEFAHGHFSILPQQ